MSHSDHGLMLEMSASNHFTEAIWSLQLVSYQIVMKKTSLMVLYCIWKIIVLILLMEYGCSGE